MKTAKQYLEEARMNLSEKEKTYSKDEAIKFFKHNAPSEKDAADISWTKRRWVNNVTGEVVDATEKTKPTGTKDHVSPLDR